MVLNRLDARRIAALPVLWMALWLLGSFAASAQELEAPAARQTVERAAQQIAAVVARAVPDQTHTILYVEPVRTDEQRPTRLGARLRGALQVTLVRHYLETRLLEQPAAGAWLAAAVRVVIDLQPFDHHVTALVRILDRDGLLIDADLVDLPRSTAISALLQPDTWLEPDAPQLTLPIPEDESPDPVPAEPAPDRPASPAPPAPLEPLSAEQAPDRPAPPEPPPAEPAPDRPASPEPPPPEPVPDRPAPPEPPPDRLLAPATPEPPPEQAPAAPAPPPADPTPLGLPEDAYEPDDDAGFEVPVSAMEDVRLERTLTGDDRDRFELSLPAAATVTVAIEAEIETLIALYLSGNAVPIGVHDRGFSGVLEAGTYLIEVLAANAATTGAYTLAVNSSPATSEAAGLVETGAQPEAALPPSGSSAAPAAEGAGAEPLAQATELQSGESQERLLRQPPEWLQLTADPGFYGVTVTSAAETLQAALHRTRDEPAFLQLVPSAAGERVGALFIGADLPVLQIDAPEADPALRYAVAFAPVSPPRAFADQTWVEQAELGSLRHHTLRIISRDVYQLSMESAPEATSAEVAVLHVPAMRQAAPQEAGVSRYDLPPGDYLVLLWPLDEGTVGRVCWHLAQGSRNCS